MKCIVGLGNPGKQYEKTRHNTGFMVLDECARFFGVNVETKKFNALYIKFRYKDEDILLIKPQTFMNASGEAVRDFVNYFKIDLKDVLVISDDLDLPIGKVRFRQGGNDGGQRGLRDIIKQCGSKDFNRCRVGIGNNKLIPTVDYVLGKVEKENQELFQQSINHATKGIIFWIEHGLQQTMNFFNGEMTA